MHNPCTCHWFEWSQQPRCDGRPVTDHCVGRCANMMGSSGMWGEKQTCFLPWWCSGASMGSRLPMWHHVGGRCASCWCLCCCSLDSGCPWSTWLSHLIQDEVFVYLSSPELLFCTGSCGYWGISWRALCSAFGCLFDGLMALHHSHSMFWALGDLLEGLMWPLGICLMGW